MRIDPKDLRRHYESLSDEGFLDIDRSDLAPVAQRIYDLVTSNLPFAEWTEVLGSERLTGALLDRLTHHVHILEMNGESYRLKNSKKKKDPSPQ
jgi:hypothetical protein